MTTAFIIVALGAPKDFEGRSVKKFLREFLSDKRVVPLPYVPRRIIAELAAQLRWRKYSRDMRMIAVDGEPSVRHYAKNILASLREAMPNDIVEVAFRYPNLSDAVERARSRGAKKFCFLPLCPHNSRSITQSARAAALETMRPGDVFEFCQSYCSHPMYIDAVADSVRGACKSGTEAVLACFHSIPLSQTENSPYVKECMRTAEELGKRDGIPHVEVAWQSQMDKGKWLGPNVEEMLGSMAGRGIKRICAVCPGFFCDCTETLIEINESARLFAKNLGMELLYAPCLNDSPAHAELLKAIFEEMR